MPRRGGGGRSPSPMGSAPRRNMTTAAPARHAPPPPPPVPVNPASNVPMMPQRQGPGMLGQIAGTAAGVAIGSAVGHTIGHAMTGGSRDSAANPREDAVNNPQPIGAPGYYQQQAAMTPSYNPCELEMKQFIECAQQNSSDISMCTGFNELLKQCRIRNGMPA